MAAVLEQERQQQLRAFGYQEETISRLNLINIRRHAEPAEFRACHSHILFAWRCHLEPDRENPLRVRYRCGLGLWRTASHKLSGRRQQFLYSRLWQPACVVLTR